MAQSHPLVNFIGIEVHRSGIGSLAADVFESGLTNVRIAPCDAQIVFKSGFNALSLDRINVFFPDPWPKKRHHKRRLIQSEFVGLLETKLKHGGVLHCATDWQAYADHMLTVLSQHAGLCNQDAAGRFIPRPDLRPMTKFEQRGLHLGHGVWDLLFIKK
jgi:tRNA (guanine-N7-)-methyltransferase